MSKDNETTEALHELVRAVRSISHGPLSGPGGAVLEPMGLEMLSMAIAGRGVSEPLSGAVRDGLSEVASSLREGLDNIAAALRGQPDPIVAEFEAGLR